MQPNNPRNLWTPLIVVCLLGLAVAGVLIKRHGIGGRDGLDKVGDHETNSRAKEFNPSKPQFVSEKEGMKLWLCVKRENLTAENSHATLEFDETALLGVVVKKGNVFYTDLDDVVIDGMKIEVDRVRSLDALPGLQNVWWFKVESQKSSYMNSDKNDGWWAKIEYVESVDAINNKSTRAVDVSPLRLGGVKWKNRHVGTMRYKVALEFADFFLSSPGKEASGRAGMLPGVRRVSRKGGTGSAPVDAGMSLANLPYIWGSAMLKGKAKPDSHQAEQFIGADCADLIIAAWHISQYSAIPYSAVVPMIEKYGMSSYGIEVVEDEEGYFYDKYRKQISFGPGGAMPGAAVAWMWKFGKKKRKGHVAMLVEDSGPQKKANGVLDKYDRVFHTLWDTPALVSIGHVLPDYSPVAVINPVLR